MATRTRPRLGKGLSGLIGQPVQVEPKQSPNIDGGPERPDSRPDRSPPRQQAPGPALLRIPITELAPNPFQPREDFDEASLRALGESIRKSGMIQPIAVRRLSNGRSWEIVAGERRWRAARLAGLDRVPAVECAAGDRDAAELALIENLQREDLNPIERARGFRSLIDRFGMSQVDVAVAAGIARASVTNTLRLLELEPEIQQLIRKGSVSLGHGKALLGAPRGERRVEVASRIASEQWTVRQAESWAAKQVHATERPRSPGTRTQGPGTADLERQLSEHLGTKVMLRTRASGKEGRLMIEFYSIDQFDALMRRIGFSPSS